MSILGSIYKSMTGLLGFTSALDNLSNNISNMNTPGFKGRDLYFRELTGGSNELGYGNYSMPSNGFGVGIAGSSVRFSAGDINSTTNDTDLAVNGIGFFVLRDEQSVSYSRAGQFRFNEDGFLVDPATNMRVAALSSSGQLQDIYLDIDQTMSATQTGQLAFKGNINSATAIGSSLPSATTGYEFEVIDASGATYSIFLNFTKKSNQTWELRVWDEQNNLVVEPYEMRFEQDGDLMEAFRYFDFLYNPKNIEIEDEMYEGIDLGRQTLFPAGNASFSLPATTDVSYLVLDNEVSSLSDGLNVRFTTEGFLVDSMGRHVATLDDDGKLSEINIKDLLEISPVSTTLIEVSGNLERSLSNSSVIPDITNGDLPFEFTVIDSEGSNHNFTLHWTKVVDDQWLVDVIDETGNDVVSNEVINFDFNGFVVSSDRKLPVSFQPSGANVMKFNIDFGNASQSFAFKQVVGQLSSFTVESVDGSDRIPATDFEIIDGEIHIFYADGSDALGPKLALGNTVFDSAQELRFDFISGEGTALTSMATSTSVKLESTDAKEAGNVVGYSFNEDGELVIQFSNGEEETLARVALANFTSLNTLIPIGDSYFRLPDQLTPHFGYANEGSFGQMKSRSLEMSNVDLSKEFADIIIVQRGYQASSQVLNVSNELIQELYDSTKGQ